MLMKTMDEKAESVYNLGSEDTVSSIVTIDEDNMNLSRDTNFLIIDFRDEADYRRCHIQDALSFPAIRIRRDQWTAEIARFKNQPDKVIIVYDDTGFAPSSIETATSFVEKGFDNIMLLSGGIKHFATKYPDRLIGQYEEFYEDPPTPRRHGRRDVKQQDDEPVSLMDQLSLMEKTQAHSPKRGRLSRQLDQQHPADQTPDKLTAARLALLERSGARHAQAGRSPQRAVGASSGDTASVQRSMRSYAGTSSTLSRMSHLSRLTQSNGQRPWK
jgi:rhodanese-related sulfurtransferase